MSDNTGGTPAEPNRPTASLTKGGAEEFALPEAAAGEETAPDAIPVHDPRLVMRQQGLSGYADEFFRRMRSGDLGSVPVVVALIVIWVVFQILSGSFLTAGTLSTIAQDVVGPGMMAVGIVFVLLLGEIDLAVSYVGGVAGAIFAVLSVRSGVPEVPALLLSLVTGTVLGALHGFFFARIGVPAFVVTLAGFLAWNGLMLQVLGQHGTVQLPQGSLLYELYNYTFEDVAAAYGLALVATLLYAGFSLLEASRRRKAGIPFRPLTDIVVKTVVLAVIAFAAAYVLNQSNGLPLDLVIFLVFLVALDLVLRRTPYGRQIFAVGGGIEAARRAGINVSWVRISVFMISGTMAAVGGLFLAGQVNSAQSNQGSGNTLMEAIAAAVIGGTSLFGGRGKTWSALLGALVIVSIKQGMFILNLNIAIQYMITGAVLLASVVVDSVSRRTQQAAGRA